jgi:hypothetical protein
VFTHLTPPPPVKMMEPVFVRGVAEVRRQGWTLAEDGTLVELEAGRDEITIRSID